MLIVMHDSGLQQEQRSGVKCIVETAFVDRNRGKNWVKKGAKTVHSNDVFCPYYGVKNEHKKALKWPLQ